MQIKDKINIFYADEKSSTGRISLDTRFLIIYM